MSGWIKVEKCLTEQIKFRRVVRKLRETSNALRDVTKYAEAFAVTLTLGALVRFWIYADSHIRDDDTLDITLDEINELVGVDGFAQALPAEWLQVIDAERVQLPNFLAHNGSSEKQRRDNARRQAAYRHRHHSRNVTRDVTPSNASNVARLDQTRPEKTRQDIRKSAGEELDAHEVTERIRMTYPRGTYRASNWVLAEREIGKLLDAGETPAALLQATGEFHAQQFAKGSIDTQFVLSPEKFFGPDGHWRGPFPLPATKAEVRLAGNISAADEFMRRTETQ